MEHPGHKAAAQNHAELWSLFEECLAGSFLHYQLLELSPGKTTLTVTHHRSPDADRDVVALGTSLTFASQTVCVDGTETALTGERYAKTAP